METQKIANLLGNPDNESLKFATRKLYVINDQNNTDYGDGGENGTDINNIRSVILEIENDRCKIVKILIFRSLSQEHFQS